MFSKEYLAVDIGSSFTKLLFGDRHKIKLCGLIKTPENSVLNDNIVDTNALRNVILAYLRQNALKPTEVSFAIHGQDIIIRHIEVPIMDEKGTRKAVEWEISQYLPENGMNYYMDYEVLGKISTKEKKVSNLLVVAAPKAKVNKYAELAYGLGLKLKAIDIAANCISRIFRQSVKDSAQGISTGIFDIGHRNSNVIILDRGKLFIEREVNFGVKNAITEISKSLNIDDQKSYEYLFQKFDFGRIRQDNEVDKSIQNIFEDALSSIDKVIQFYTTGRTQKSLDRIYVLGGGSQIPGIGSYLKEYFGSSVYVINSPTKVSLKIKFPASFDFKVYANALGLLLRKE